jgi:acetyl esterase/lipase
MRPGGTISPTWSASMAISIRTFWRPLLAGVVVSSSVACTPSPGTLPAPTARSASASQVMTAQDLLALPHRAPDALIAYGEDSSQYGELRVPPGTGPHPVVVLIHGGCWREFSAAGSIAPMADALKDEGIATWSIEYRRLHQPGGGWPGTYLDVGRAVDHLRSIAAAHHLDLARVVVVGHSAGGHLAMWVAARSRLAAGTPLHVTDPLPIRGVVDLSGTPDMAGELPGLPTACGEDVVQSMLGGTAAAVPERYAQVSAIRMLPLGIPQALIWGARDDQVPLAIAERYTSAARQSGDNVRFVVDSAAGHFEPASPYSPLWPAVRSAIRSLLDGTFVP